jgi:neprilysin
MVKNLMESLKDLLVMAKWMDESTTIEAILKVHAIKTFIGYPDWIANRTLLESYYSDVSKLAKLINFS